MREFLPKGFLLCNMLKVYIILPMVWFAISNNIFAWRFLAQMKINVVTY